MINIIRLLILFELTLLPILPATNQFGYEYIKILFFIFLNSLIGLLWMILVVKKQLEIFWTKIKLLSFLLIIILLISSLVGMDPLVSIIGRDPYYQGWIVYAYCFLFFLIISSITLSFKEIATPFLISSTIVSTVAIAQLIQLGLFHQQVSTYAGRVVSTFGQPNFYAGWLLFSLPFIWFNIKDQDKRIVLLAKLSLIFSVLAIIISLSRSAILIMIGLGLLYLVGYLQPLKRIKIFILVVICCLVMARLLTFTFQAEILDPFSSQFLKYNSPEKRVLIWPVILDLFSKRPILGYGLENLNQAFRDYSQFWIKEAKPAYFYTLRTITVDRAHNFILDLLIFSGLFGLITWLILIWRLAFAARSKVLLTALLIYLIWIQLQNQSIAHLIFFWLLIGLIDSEATIDSK